MEAKTSKDEPLGLASPQALREKFAPHPRATRICCGHAVEPYLAEVRDSRGSKLFVSVWRCPRCARVRELNRLKACATGGTAFQAVLCEPDQYYKVFPPEAVGEFVYTG